MVTTPSRILGRKTYACDYVTDYTSFENDDLMVFAEGNGQLEYEQKHVYAGDERIEQFTDKGNWERTLYVHEDVMGNTRYYTKANGQSFAELTYDAWGMPESPNKLLNNDHGNYVFATFTGHIYDTTLDIYFAEAGCRMGEALGLRWEDVDFEKRIIHITHAAKYRPGTTDKAQWMITEPKTKAGIRDIPMIDQVYDALKAEYKIQQDRGFPTPTINGMSGFIFVNEEGRLRSPEAINRAIETVIKWCNKEEEQKVQQEKREPIIIPHFSCHVFRHPYVKPTTKKFTTFFEDFRTAA